MFSEVKRNLQKTCERIINLGRQDAKGMSNMGLKLMEEVGELAECINFQLGYLPHKTMKEPLVGEAADVVQNVLAILAKAYPDLDSDEIVALLFDHLEKKTDKWESVMVKAPIPSSPPVIVGPDVRFSSGPGLDEIASRHRAAAPWLE